MVRNSYRGADENANICSGFTSTQGNRQSQSAHQGKFSTSVLVQGGITVAINCEVYILSHLYIIHTLCHATEWKPEQHEKRNERAFPLQS